jgi:hypothetical protein
MGHEDRDWYREDRKRRDNLVTDKNRRWRWPYRLRPDLPWWLAESLRIAIFMVPFVVAYYAWKYFL